MGSILSVVTDAYYTVAAVVHTIANLNRQYQAMMKRVEADPGLPVKNPTASYWLDDPPFPDLVDVQHPLPESASVVIIGSGITAAAAVRTMLKLHDETSSSKPPSIVVLEARQLCGGATGRNGGHMKCVPHEAFGSFTKSLGGKGNEEKAARLVRLQLSHTDVLKEVGDEVAPTLGEVRRVETVDYFMEGKDFEKAKKQIGVMRRWLPEVDVKMWEAEEARKKFGVSDVIVGAVSYPAGACWPYRLVTSVWNDLLDSYPDHLTISTHTPVEDISTNDSPSHPVTITTSRGAIKASRVLHATNAFATNFIPSLRFQLTGVLAHMTAQTPPSGFPTNPDRSWSFIYNPAYDYITQRPNGDLMVGGGFLRSKEQGLDQVGVWDDSRMDAFPRIHLGGMVPVVYGGQGGMVKKSWSGIVGITGDMLPFVGKLSGKLTGRDVSRGRVEDSGGVGEYISAGYTGDGMVWAWLCGTAVAIMIMGLEGEDLPKGVGRPGGRLRDWFPLEEVKVDEKRKRRADLRNMADEIM